MKFAYENVRLAAIFMKIKYLLLFLLGWSSAFSQRNTNIFFAEKQADTIDHKIDSILLVGAGSTTTRIFLDDLSQYIMKELTKGNIVTNYYYLGKSISEAKSELDTINKKGYKAILFFLPKGESFFEAQAKLNRISPTTRIGTITTTFATSRIDYQQNFSFQLCFPDSNMNRMWSALVEVSGDLSKAKITKKVGTKVLYYFRKNKYIK